MPNLHYKRIYVSIIQSSIGNDPQYCVYSTREMRHHVNKAWWGFFSFHFHCSIVSDSCMLSDVVFVVQNTEGMGGRNWTYTKQFLIDTAKSIMRENAGNRVGFIKFTQGATLLWDLDGK